jgi:hypothetical protein
MFKPWQSRWGLALAGPAFNHQPNTLGARPMPTDFTDVSTGYIPTAPVEVSDLTFDDLIDAFDENQIAYVAPADDASDSIELDLDDSWLVA